MMIEPVSNLSIKRAVNLYTIILFLSFGVLLFWLATDRYNSFVDTHKDKAERSTKIAAYQINRLIKEKHRIIDIFIESSSNLLTQLNRNPDNELTQRQLNERLKKYLPDFFAFNIMSSSGQPLVDDFDGNISELCLADLRDFIENGKEHIRLHPNNNAYHYDLTNRYRINGIKKIFFISFYVDDISYILNSVQPKQHQLLVINKNSGNLIEITPQGSRKTMRDRLDYRMYGDENLRLISTTEIIGTDWHVIDIHNPDLFYNYRNKTFFEYIIIYYAFSIIVLLMRYILINQDEKRTTAELRLQENHKQIKALNNQLELLSKTDGLTGLYNRRYFDELIKLEWNRGIRSNNTLSCVIFDIDYFKEYNDCYGHQAGDKCLTEISKLMQDCFRRAGDVVTRYGGEEFIVLMAACSPEETASAIDLFQSELAKLCIKHEASKIQNCVTISAGFVNEIPTQDETIENFIRKADEALYAAKANGKNQTVKYE